MKNRLNTGNYPKGDSSRGTVSIQDAISIGTPYQRKGELGIDIIIDLVKAPFAAAYEWGSGINRMIGAREKYPITARKAPRLVFFWERENRLFVGHQVSHPGVEAKQYIAPTLVETRKEVLNIVGKSVKESVTIMDRQITTFEATV
jgi:hypothetical protein